MKNKLSKKQAIDKLWRLGNLEWKLKGIQKEMRNAVYETSKQDTVFLISRRSGKTFTMMTIAVEHCIKKPNCVVKVIFPKKKDAKSVSKYQMKTILEDCPVDLMPEWKEADKIYVFPNGSEIQMTGTDGGSAESIRGSGCDLALLDEAGFHDYNEFSYIVRSIILPTLMTTKGKMVLASTPSKEPDHPFMTEYVIPSRIDSSIIEYTIDDNPLITKEQIEEFAKSYPGGLLDPDFRREYYNEFTTSGKDFVVPEFTAEVEKDIVREFELPAYFDYYVSGDPAVTDLTVILFAYYDFLNSCIVINDELVLGGEGSNITTKEIADGIKRKIKLLFSNKLTGESPEPKMLIMDNNNKFLLNDLYQEHGLAFTPTAKDNKEAQINKVRMMISQGRIYISPKCKNLIYHLKSTRWSRSKKEFLRSKGNLRENLKAHHGDAIDALIYLVRNMDIQSNPYPSNYGAESKENLFFPRNIKESNPQADFMKTLMGIKEKNNN